MFIIHTNIKNRSWANAYIWKTDGSRGGVSANYGEACKEKYPTRFARQASK